MAFLRRRRQYDLRVSPARAGCEPAVSDRRIPLGPGAVHRDCGCAALLHLREQSAEFDHRRSGYSVGSPGLSVVCQEKAGDIGNATFSHAMLFRQFVQPFHHLKATTAVVVGTLPGIDFVLIVARRSVAGYFRMPLTKLVIHNAVLDECPRSL